MAATLLPLIVNPDTTLRVKITDACGLTCTFCHNEGTPVAVDNRGLTIGEFKPSGLSGRVSIYTPTNGATFLPGPIPADSRFGEAISALREALDFGEIHLTGGEPTLHAGIADLVSIAVRRGYQVGMTSNGENGKNVLDACARSGLDRVNFSIFGTTPEELADVQDIRFRNVTRAARKIHQLKESIAVCVELGVKASANIVVLDYSHAPRVHRLLDEYAPELSVRLLNSLDHGSASVDAIERILAERKAEAEARYMIAGASGSRTAYRLPDGRRVFFKQIRRVRLPETCGGCRFNNDTDCQEGYYGVRLYYDKAGKFQVGVCIQRMDLCLPLEQFLDSPRIGEIRELRAKEWDRFATQQAG